MSEDHEAIIERQRKEKKDLREKIIALKRNSAKKEKKKLQDEIAQMEKDLLEKHTLELSNLKLDDPVEESEQTIATPEDDGILRKSKAQKRRERKEQEAKRRDVEIQQAEEENKTSSRQIESKAINRILKARNLTLHHIKSDGDCLYNAIRHQLELAGRFYSIEELRKIAANYIRANKDELIFYMPSVSGELMSDKEFEDYCNQVENTKAWGSQVEIQALSNSLKVKIEILQAEGCPTISGSDHENCPHLIVTYHRHFFGLGEHYNSTKSNVSKANDQDNQDD